MSSNDPHVPPGEAFHPASEETTQALPPVVPPSGAHLARPLPRLTFPLHPGFWWALLWCVALLLFTQVPAGLVAGVLLIIVLLLQPGKMQDIPMGDPGALANLPEFQLVIGIALWVAHFLIIMFALLALLIVVGRDWQREVALRRPSLAHVLLVIAGTPAFIVLAQFAYHLLQRLGFPSVNNIPATLCFLVSLFTTLAIAGVVCLFLRLTLGQHWGRRLARDWMAPVPLAASVVCLLVFVATTALLYNIWLPSFRQGLAGLAPVQGKSGMEEMEKVIGGWPIVIAIFIIGVMPGLSEELWCRAYLGRGLVGTHGYFWGVVLTSFLFGLIHLDPVQGTMAMVVGVVLHLIYLWGRSLFLPMLLHFLNNSLAVTITRIPGLKELEEPAPGAEPWLLVFTAFVLLLVVLVTLYQSRARLVSVDDRPPWEPPYPGVVCPPPESNTRVVNPPVHLGLASLVMLALAGFTLALVLPFLGAR